MVRAGEVQLPMVSWNLDSAELWSEVIYFFFSEREQRSHRGDLQGAELDGGTNREAVKMRERYILFILFISLQWNPKDNFYDLLSHRPGIHFTQLWRVLFYAHSVKQLPHRSLVEVACSFLR